jgi:hypothetical protein
MKINLLWGALVVAGFPLLSSCDKDEKPKPAGITFESDLEEVSESDGTFESFHPALTGGDGTGREIEVKLILDKPLAETSVISYSVEGSAVANSASTPIGDYEIDGDENLIIEKGATEAVISIQLYEDGSYEFTDYNDDGLPYENIIITLESVVSGPITIGEAKTYQLDILEDDALVFLVWDPQDDAGEDIGDVDMNLFAWLDGELWDYSVGVNEAQSAEENELLILSASFPDGEYTFSYTYYNGTSNDLDFSAVMFGNLDGENHPYPEEPFVSGGNYTLVNKNTYPASTTEPPEVAIVQSMTKSGISFTNISGITEPATGSRKGNKQSVKLTPEVLRKLKLDPNTRSIQRDLTPFLKKK